MTEHALVFTMFMSSLAFLFGYWGGYRLGKQDGINHQSINEDGDDEIH
jgi:hypothetical protein